jgi:hypothetical protein
MRCGRKPPNAAPETIISSNGPSGGASKRDSPTGVVGPAKSRLNSPICIGGAFLGDIEAGREGAGVLLGVL